MADEVREIPTRIQYLRQRIQPALEEPIRTHILVGAVALGVGAGVGYILGKRNKYEAIVEVEPETHTDPNQMRFEFDSDELAEELEEMREFVEELKENRRIRAEAKVENDGDIRQTFVIEEEREDPGDLVIHDPQERDFSVEDFVAKRLEQALGSAPLDPEDEPVVETIFAEDDGWNLEEEMAQRTTTAPYILHKDEFYAEEKGYTQTTLTYYAGDDILVDQEDSPIYNHERVTGPLKFGHGSGDANVLYVRNDRLRAEYEILYDSGLFSEEVLGLEIPNNQRVRDNPRDRDLRHSNYRKFRQTE